MPPASNSTRSVVVAIAVVAGLAELAYAVMNISAMPVYLHLPRVAGGMGYGADGVAAIATAFLMCEGLMKGPFGILGDRIGRKRLIIAGPLVSAFTSLLTLVVHPHQWYLFVLLRVLDGLGAAALWPSALALIADVIEEDRRSQAMSLFNVTYLIGIALGPFIGGIANDLTAFFTQSIPRAVAERAPDFVARHVHEMVINPLHASFYVISVLFLLTALVAWRRIPELVPQHHHQASDLETGFSFRALMQSLRQIPETLLMAFVTFLGIGQLIPIIKLFALAELDVTETQFGALLLVPCLFIALASVPLGTIGDRIGKPSAVRWGLGLCAFAMWGLILTKSRMMLAISGSLIGVGFVIAFPAWMALVSASCESRQRGAVMGAVGTAQGIGAMLGALLGGLFYEHATIPLPGMPESLARWIAFMKVESTSETTSAVILNAHYVPFIGCALLIFTSWLLAYLTIRENSSCT